MRSSVGRWGTLSTKDTTVADGAAGSPEHFDVLIVGAGISGIGGAYHLTDQLPGKSYVVLETQGGYGGTWRTHTYPGIRSASDLYTFGYRFKPWLGDPIATAEEIQKYLGEVIEENDLVGIGQQRRDIGCHKHTHLFTHTKHEGRLVPGCDKPVRLARRGRDDLP